MGTFGTGTAAAQEATTGQDEAGDTGGGATLEELWTPTYLNRPAWGADERLRLGSTGEVAYPVAFYPVQKITVHHTASWTPWTPEDSVELVQAVYREHVAQDFGDIGYHLLIDPLGVVYEGRYSGGTSFPIYETYPGWTSHAPPR